MLQSKSDLTESLIKVFSDSSLIEFENYNGSLLVVKILQDFQTINTILRDFFNEVTILAAGKVEIKLSSCKFDNFFVYYDENDYLNNYDNYKDKFKNAYILSHSSLSINGFIILCQLSSN